MTASNILISAHNLQKTFITGMRKSKYTRDLVVALKDVSFDLYAGESVGIVGSNGAGKTTLLRAIGGTLTIDSGQITRYVTPRMIISLGGSFLPQLTGRENVFLYGSFLGMTQQELKKALPKMVAFAELKSVIDEPLRDYSAGMRARLAFSVATHGNPKLVCMDEVIGAGDEYFQQKSAKRIKELTQNGTTFVITSHNTPQLTQIVDRIIEMKDGQIIKNYRPEKPLL